ncbi:MAG: hypothetical protein ABR518_05260 [Actinomycetota bacterium]
MSPTEALDPFEPKFEPRPVVSDDDPEPEPGQTLLCSRCHQPSERPVCDTCAEALDLLRALSVD